MSQPILLVEDDENDVTFMKMAFKKAGVDLPMHVATHGQEALDYFQGRGRFAKREDFPLPCLVLLDLKLPFVMGLGLLRWIREQPELESTVVIILSASSDDQDVQTAYELGANAYLVKPADLEKLYLMAHAIKDFWLTYNRPVSNRAAVKP
ncbi:MAG: response regulator [Verrucomicrobia bacterium]|nr:response regulator [Verrucomicrobiota bacterium]